MIWLLIGVAKAIDVRVSFREGNLIKKEGSLDVWEIRNPIKEPNIIAYRA